MKQHAIEALAQAGLILTLAAGTLCAEEVGERAPVFTDIEVSYKLDPRITKATYIGERWVSPPTYSIAGDGKAIVIEARAQGIERSGKRTAISPQWIPEDAAMVLVSPGEGKQVKITVQRVGESNLLVTYQGVTKVLAIKAAELGDGMQVEIARRRTELPPESASTQETALKTQKERLSYSFGADLGKRLRSGSWEVDPELLIQGIRDALAGNTLLTDQQIRNALLSRQAELKMDQAKELAGQTKAAGEAFLAENKNKDGVVTLESGLQYKILKEGDGMKPTIDDRVVCHYRGTLIEGTEFDSSHKRSRPSTFAVKGVIKGWTEALQLMPVGSKWQLFIPSSLGYGERGARGKIGPNAALIFEVELISILGKE